MNTVLQLTNQDIDTEEKRAKYSIAIVGCSQRGIYYANAFAEAGFLVTCTDDNPSIVKKTAKGKTFFLAQDVETKLKALIKKGRITVSSELKKTIPKSDIIIITIKTKVDKQKNNDYTHLINTCKQIGATLHQGTLVIYSGVASLGFTEGTIKEVLENTSGLKAGQDFGLAYNSLLSSSSSKKELNSVVAATDKKSLESTSTILNTVIKNIKVINEIRTAEMAVLFSIAYQESKKALANELAIFCESSNIDYFKVIENLSLEDQEFKPSILNEDNNDEAYLLLDSAENLNTKLNLTSLARRINEDMVKHAVNLIRDSLRSCGKTLRRGKVAIIGSADPNSAMSILAKMVELKGAKVKLYDPVNKREPIEVQAIKRRLTDAVEGTDCIIVLPEQEQIYRINLKKLKALMKTPAAVVDLAGKFVPEQVEKEGFIYSGLGRGNEKK